MAGCFCWTFNTVLKVILLMQDDTIWTDFIVLIRIEYLNVL